MRKERRQCRGRKIWRQRCRPRMLEVNERWADSCTNKSEVTEGEGEVARGRSRLKVAGGEGEMGGQRFPERGGS